MECKIYVHVLDFYGRSIAVQITVYIPYLFLPTHVLYISSGHFCAPEYCSVFARIQMSSAYTVYVLYLEHFSVSHAGAMVSNLAH